MGRPPVACRGERRSPSKSSDLPSPAEPTPPRRLRRSEAGFAKAGGPHAQPRPLRVGARGARPWIVQTQPHPCRAGQRRRARATRPYMPSGNRAMDPMPSGDCRPTSPPPTSRLRLCKTTLCTSAEGLFAGSRSDAKTNLRMPSVSASPTVHCREGRDRGSATDLSLRPSRLRRHRAGVTEAAKARPGRPQTERCTPCPAGASRPAGLTPSPPRRPVGLRKIVEQPYASRPAAAGPVTPGRSER